MRPSSLSVVIVATLCMVACVHAGGGPTWKDLIGTWTNELGSTCTLRDAGAGVLDGNYTTAVGGSWASQPVVARYSQSLQNPGILLEMSVIWTGHATRAITTWIGQCFCGADGTPYIQTMWLLARETNQSNAWASITTGSDLFVKAA